MPLAQNILCLFPIPKIVVQACLIWTAGAGTVFSQADPSSGLSSNRKTEPFICNVGIIIILPPLKITNIMPAKWFEDSQALISCLKLTFLIHFSLRKCHTVT